MSDSRATTDALDAACRLLSARARVLEAVDLDYSGWWGLNPQDLGIGDTPGFDLGGPSSDYSAALTYLNRRKHGDLIPAYLNEQQLRRFRQKIRRLVISTPIALNVVAAHQSYGIGEGFRYECTPRKRQGQPADPAAIDLAAQAQVWVDAFVEANELAIRESDIISRILVDGEAIVRLFPTRSGLLTIRTIEPEFVWSPTGDSNDDSFGVRNPPGDPEGIEGYLVVTGDPDRGAMPEFVTAREIVHIKHPETPPSAKRGWSPFYAVFGELTAANDLLMSTVSMAKARAKLAWIEKMDSTSVDVAQSLVSNLAAATANDPVTGQTVTFEKYRPGTILRTSSDVEMPAANISAADHVAVIQAVLRVVAARFSMPEYMLSSDASNANYASTLVAESPFVKAMSRWQDYLGRALGRNRYGPRRSLVWRQLAHAVDQGLLPREVFRLVDIQVTGPTLTVRDAAQEAQVDAQYHQMGVKSRTTIQLEQNLDPDVEAANFAKEKATEPQSDSQPGQPDGQDQLGQPGQSAPPAPTGVNESTDASGHEHAVDGKFGSGGGSSSAHDSSTGSKAISGKAAKILDFAKALPARLAAKVKDTVARKYASLSERYGPKYARAIIAAGIAGVPLPVPGSSLLTAAPVIALAELHRRLSGPHLARESVARELSDEEIHDAAEELIEELCRAFGVPTPESFTGTKVDSLGRKRCYDEGKLVPCGGEGHADDSAARMKSPAKISAPPGTAARAAKGTSTPPPEKAPSEKAARAKAAAVRVDRSVQQYAEEYNEPRFAKVVRGVSHSDNEPMDVTAHTGDLVELKTMCVGADDKLTMNSYAQVRKIVKEREAGRPFHTVVSDDRKVFNAKGEGAHGNESQRVYYYRRGVAGSARLEALHRCESEAELLQLMALPESELPEKARRTDGHLRKGRWKFFEDEKGKGYRNARTGQEFRAKK